MKIMLILSFGLWIPAQQAQLSKGTTLVDTRISYFQETENQEDLRIAGLQIGLERMLTKRVGLYGSSSFSQAEGMREGEQADALLLGLAFSLRWYAVNRATWHLYLDHGWGLVFSDKPFPPEGSKVNGSRHFGFGVGISMNASWLTSISWSAGHVSNGRGLVDENPSLDGMSLEWGVRYVF